MDVWSITKIFGMWTTYVLKFISQKHMEPSKKKEKKKLVAFVAAYTIVNPDWTTCAIKREYQK